MEFLIRADAPKVQHKKHWQFCVGSGHALLALRTDYTKQLKFIHDTLGIDRVRFHGIFNDDMRTRTNLSQMFPAPGAENFTEENFRACGLGSEDVHHPVVFREDGRDYLQPAAFRGALSR